MATYYTVLRRCPDPLCGPIRDFSTAQGYQRVREMRCPDCGQTVRAVAYTKAETEAIVRAERERLREGIESEQRRLEARVEEVKCDAP